jgi:hypothetical protein
MIYLLVPRMVQSFYENPMNYKNVYPLTCIQGAYVTGGEIVFQVVVYSKPMFNIYSFTLQVFFILSCSNRIILGLSNNVLFDNLQYGDLLIWQAVSQHKLDSIWINTVFFWRQINTVHASYNASCDDQTKFIVTQGQLRRLEGEIHTYEHNKLLSSWGGKSSGSNTVRK